MKTPNPNLWNVDYTFAGGYRGTTLIVCASSPSVAERKARTFLKRRGTRGVAIVKVEHGGTIDAF